MTWQNLLCFIQLPETTKRKNLAAPGNRNNVINIFHGEPGKYMRVAWLAGSQLAPICCSRVYSTVRKVKHLLIKLWRQWNCSLSIYFTHYYSVLCIWMSNSWVIPMRIIPYHFKQNRMVKGPIFLFCVCCLCVVYCTVFVLLLLRLHIFYNKPIPLPAPAPPTDLWKPL